MAGAGAASRLREVIVKYGRVAIGVHLSISATTFWACYLAARSSLDVESLLTKVGLMSASDHAAIHPPPGEASEASSHQEAAVAELQKASYTGWVSSATQKAMQILGMEGTPEDRSKLVGSGGAFAVAFLCNKALIPVRVPVTIAVTPRVWRFLTSRGWKV